MAARTHSPQSYELDWTAWVSNGRAVHPSSVMTCRACPSLFEHKTRLVMKAMMSCKSKLLHIFWSTGERKTGTHLDIPLPTAFGGKAVKQEELVRVDENDTKYPMFCGVLPVNR